MLFTLHLLFSDAALGRLDANSIDDQSSMELCFEGLTSASKARFTNDQGLFLDVCEWDYIACDDAMHVENINIQKKLNGAFNYKFLQIYKDLYTLQK